MRIHLGSVREQGKRSSSEVEKAGPRAQGNDERRIRPPRRVTQLYVFSVAIKLTQLDIRREDVDSV